MNDFLQAWCNERHDKIKEEFDTVWKKIDTIDGRMWAIIVLLFLNLGGVIASIVIK